MRKRERAQLEASAKQTLPAKANRERFGVKKILVAEPRVVRDDHRVGFQCGAGPEAEVELAHFHRASKGSRQPRGEAAVQARVGYDERCGGVEQPDRTRHDDNPLQRATDPPAPCAIRSEAGGFRKRRDFGSGVGQSELRRASAARAKFGIRILDGAWWGRK